MSELQFSPYQMLQQAAKMFKAKQYTSVLKLTTALMLKFQPSAPLLLLAAASACRLSHLAISRHILRLAKTANCFLDKDFRIQLYEIILVTEFNARTDQYYTILLELLKLTRNVPSQNMRVVQFYHALSRMNITMATAAVEDGLGLFDEVQQLCFKLLKKQSIDFSAVSPKNQLHLAHLDQFLACPTVNLVFSKDAQITRKPLQLSNNQFMTLSEEAEVLNHADWRVACHYFYDYSGEQLGDVSTCSRIFNHMKLLGFYNEEDVCTSVLKLVSIWSQRNIICAKLVALMHGVFHNMSLVWRSDRHISKAFCIASLVSVNGAFQYSFDDLQQIHTVTTMAELFEAHPRFLDITAANTEYIAQFSGFFDQESRFQVLFNLYLAVNQQDAAKHVREHYSLLLFQQGKRLGCNADVLLSFLVGKYAPFVYDSENSIDSFKRLTARQIHCILEITDCKNQIMMDRLFKLLKSRADAHSSLLRITLLLMKSSLNEDFRQAFMAAKQQGQAQVCADVDGKAAKQLFLKYGQRIREEIDQLLGAQYLSQTVAPRQLLISTLCYMLQFELDLFKAETLSQYVLSAYEGLKVSFQGTENEYLITLLAQVAAKLHSRDVFYYTQQYPKLAVYRAMVSVHYGELGLAADEALAALNAGQNSQMLKTVVKSIYDAYFARKRPAAEFSATFAQKMNELALATYTTDDSEPWLVYPNAVVKKIKGECQCNVSGSGEQVQFAQQCLDALHGKIIVNDIRELAGMIQ